MRRAIRNLMNAATILSLVLCVVTSVLWVRSYFKSDMLNLPYKVSGNVLDGQTDERWGESLYGELHFIHNLHRFHYLTSRNQERPRPLSWMAVVPNRARTIKGTADGRRTATLHPPHGWNMWGFGLGRSRGGGGNPNGEWSILEATIFAVPHWFVALVFLAIAAPGIRRAIRTVRLRRAPGLCRQCGYDLRATPDRCPECGAVPLATAVGGGGVTSLERPKT